VRDRGWKGVDAGTLPDDQKPAAASPASATLRALVILELLGNAGLAPIQE
jgi:hypothetical protein